MNVTIFVCMWLLIPPCVWLCVHVFVLAVASGDRWSVKWIPYWSVCFGSSWKKPTDYTPRCVTHTHTHTAHCFLLSCQCTYMWSWQRGVYMLTILQAFMIWQVTSSHLLRYSLFVSFSHIHTNTHLMEHKMATLWHCHRRNGFCSSVRHPWCREVYILWARCRWNGARLRRCHVIDCIKPKHGNGHWSLRSHAIASWVLLHMTAAQGFLVSMLASVNIWSAQPILWGKMIWTPADFRSLPINREMISL